jgi:hypothetical protein
MLQIHQGGEVMRTYLSSKYEIEEGLSEYREECGIDEYLVRIIPLVKKAFREGKPLHEVVDLPLLEDHEVCYVEPDVEAYMNLVRLNKEREILKAEARRRGLRYWPAHVSEPDTPIEVFIFAEEILARKHGFFGDLVNPPKNSLQRIFGDGDKPVVSKGGWDIHDVNGLSPDTVKQMWKNADQELDRKFRLQVSSGRMSMPEESYMDFASHVRAWSYFQAVDKTLLNKIDDLALSALGELDIPARYAALHGTCDIDEQDSIYPDDLRWDLVEEVQGKRLSIRLKYAPIKLQWRKLYSKMPNGLRKSLDYHAVSKLGTSASGYSPLAKGFSIKLYKQLCKICKANPFGYDSLVGHQQPAYKLAYLFSNQEEIKRFARVNKLDARAIHDAGQFYMPSHVSKEWKDLALKYGSAVTEHASKWQAIESLLGFVPDSLQALRIASAKATYELDHRDDGRIADAAAKANLSAQGYTDYVNWYVSLTPKKAECIPAPTAQDGKYRVVQAAHDDPLAPLAGIITNCCQHPLGAASDCARAIIEEERAAIWYILDNKDNMVAMTYVWRNGDTLVLDSIESKDHDVATRIISVLKKALVSVKGRLDIEKFHLGGSGYGITGAVKDLLMPRHTNAVGDCPSSYSDAKIQLLINI